MCRDTLVQKQVHTNVIIVELHSSQGGSVTYTVILYLGMYLCVNTDHFIVLCIHLHTEYILSQFSM